MARRKNSGSDGMLFKTGIFALIAAAAFWVFNQFGGKQAPPESFPPGQSTLLECQVPDEALPAPAGGQIVRHTYFVLSYNETHEQADWVAYELRRDRLERPWASRPSTFMPDPFVTTKSAAFSDYSRSGYDKGHLCAAADMAFDEQAIQETFFMSNMSPQIGAFNGGIWRELEELTRDWARKYERLYVVTGPVLNQQPLGAIGANQVTVPAAYYKVLLAKDRSIAFLLPHERSERPVMDFACSIDAVEEATGIDFFPELLSGPDEALEQECDRSLWPVNQGRYRKRIDEWNRR